MIDLERLIKEKVVNNLAMPHWAFPGVAFVYQLNPKDPGCIQYARKKQCIMRRKDKVPLPLFIRRRFEHPCITVRVLPEKVQVRYYESNTLVRGSFRTIYVNPVLDRVSEKAICFLRIVA